MLLEREVVQFLRSSVGALMTAYVLGEQSTTALKPMCEQNTEVDIDVYERAHIMYNAVKKLQPFEADETIQSFMVGMNPVLGDRAPVAVIREEDPSDSLRLINYAITDFIHN